MSSESAATLIVETNNSCAGNFPVSAELSPQIDRAMQVTAAYASRAIYATCYCASYGITFPVVFLAHLIPGGIPLAAGIADGARAARVYVRGVQLTQKRMHRCEPASNEAVAEL